MNLLEAIQNCGDNWFRHESDGENGQAYSVDGDSIYYHYRGGFCEYAHMCRLSQLNDGWEIVPPETVMAERAR